MSKKMLVNATHPEENRVAIVVDGILTELDIEVSGHEPTKGNIYKAVVVRVEPGLQAAFVDYGAERLGFLQIDEVHFETVKPGYSSGGNGSGRPRINDLLHRGQELLVQITKEERGTKGAALTTYLSLAGRYMVCMPGSQTRGVSRKVESDAERKQLKKAMAEVDLPDGFGYIVRTAGLGKTKEELQRDFNYLKRLYDGIRELAANARAPALLYKESNLVIRSIRDYFTTDMDEVLIDDPDVFREAKDFFQRVMPEHAGLVKLHQERRPIFARYQIEDQIETINQGKVPLQSGGSIVIDPTEALVAVDVNSGKMTSEQGVESTAYKTNLEAAEEIGRQLRLRDLGGLIVIDFIDMREQKHNRAVENQLRKALESDKARISVGRISKFGLLEMSRQRIKAALAEGSSRTCQHCQGTGRIKSPETLAVGLIRRIHAGVAKGQIAHVEAKLPLDVASYLLNDKREDLLEMERRYNVQIHIHGYPHYLTEQIEIEFKKREKDKQPLQEYVEAGSLPPVSEAAEESVQEEAKEQSKDQPETAQEDNGKSRKKRRRRRRKPAAEKTAPEAAQPDGGTSPGEEKQREKTAEAAASNQQAASETAAAPPSPADETAAAEAKKPRRRRSPRKKPDHPQTAEPQESGQEQPPGDAADKPAAEPPVEGGEPPVETKPKRRASRTRGKAKTSEPTEPPAKAGAEETSQTGSPSAPPAEKEADTTEEKKPRRKRSGGKQAKTPPAAAQEQEPPEPATTADPVSIPDQAATASPAREKQTGEKPKPGAQRTEPRRKTAAKEAEQTQEKTTEEKPQESTVQEQPARDAPQEKPKRRRTPRKQAAAPPESAVTETAPEERSASAGSDGKPAPKRRSSRTGRTAKSEGQNSKQSEPVPNTAQASSSAGEEKPKRRRSPRRKTTSTQASSSSPAESAAESSKAPEEVKPKRQTRRKPAGGGTAEKSES